MAMVQCKECGGQISENADSCPHCGNVIKEPTPKFSLTDLIHKISVPVILSVAGTVITILSYFSMEGERQMEQTRKLLADAFDKDPIKQQYCIFYVDRLLASGRISPEMTVGVLSTVAANATNDTVRLDALRTMPQLLVQDKYREELKPLLVRAVSSLLPTVTDNDVLRRQLMLDLQTLVETDESYRKALIAELSNMDRNWSFINKAGGGTSDEKQLRVGLQIKLALLSLVQDYGQLEKIGADLVEVAMPSPELSKFVASQLGMLEISAGRTPVRVVAHSARQSLNSGTPLPVHAVPEERKDSRPLFIVVNDESQRVWGEQLAHSLENDNIKVEAVDAIGDPKSAKLTAPRTFEIRLWKDAKDGPLLGKLTDTIKRFTGEEPRVVVISNPNELDPGTYEIWVPKR